MAHVRWHATVHGNIMRLLRLFSLVVNNGTSWSSRKLQVTPMMLVCFIVTNRAWKSRRDSEAFECPVSQSFTEKSLLLFRIPKLHTQILTPVQDPGCSHANTYACPGSQQFKKLLMWGQAPINSEISLGFSRLPTLQMQILILVQVPDNSNSSLCWCRLPTLHTQILMPVQVPNN
ncbi:hypothetical protein O181_000686 [Austropuccinia psidii MF-1]|uniref:Uncharacterized protein n=1 Tax=Austropuccinia psidii MF-1 TaxID=1389203 RepID=A0A9Q3B9J4_9BASI|nr:hypothetical protein [Austropuccinia psidii MF-1]